MLASPVGVLLELDFVQNFDVDPFAELVELGEISLLDHLVHGVGFLLGFHITGLDLVVGVVFVDHERVVAVEGLGTIQKG